MAINQIHKLKDYEDQILDRQIREMISKINEIIIKVNTL